MSQEEKLIGKTSPAGVNDKYRFTYGNFASDKEQTNLKVSGKDLSNDELLRLLGFKENSNGEMTLSAASHKSEKDRKGKVIRRTANGRTLTGERETVER